MHMASGHMERNITRNAGNRHSNQQQQQQQQQHNTHTHHGLGFGHGDHNDGNGNNMSIFCRHFADYPSHGNLSVNNMRSWSSWSLQQQQPEDQQQQQQPQQLASSNIWSSAAGNFDMPSTRSHQLNVRAPSFTPASARAATNTALGLSSRRVTYQQQHQQHHQHQQQQEQHHQQQHPQIMPSQSQPQLPSQHNSRNLTERQSGRRQQLPDLFQTVLKLMRELNRSVSYPEIIGMLSNRLQRLPVELKRHIPHTLHGAVVNGYLRKDGNYYTLLSEQEQKEIMKRNQEAAKRAKELEKEPLSWRIR
ncbi:general transcriptional corepressor trfA [Drosophila nasuta]|uniref:general transcriptional corepressor trfA n=1 Tax=Drosophila nasuta TaxID=42062 RepID=UPI00295E45A8|nr:general transcriptional corepressor trfA [Drosophila nasuta]XP_060663930.1 general transcriptional corepressor trfA [Drosophila nasuta]